jgi:hypothetical protein
MQLTQQDYDARKARVEDGTGDDEDARLVKHYEAEGYEWRGNSSQTSADSTPNSVDSTPNNLPSTAPTTDSHSKQSEAGDSTASRTDGAGRKAGSSTRSGRETGN